MINLASGGTRGFTYDGAGNVTAEARPGAAYSYTYNAAGRMAEFRIGGVLQASYKYDAMGRQAIRTLTSPTAVTIHSVFDSEGRRIAEYNQASGALIREYVWNGWDPIAVIEGGVVSFVRADHIGRPAFATNASGVKVWSATYTPFGGVHTSTGTLPSNRFPGQWFQSESGLHQNWMRDYDPTTGRYLQPDPLGLIDGASVYGYAKQSPPRFSDPRGLEVRLYTSGQAFGSPLFNHAFIYGTECDCFAGTGGSSGSGDGANGGNMFGRPYVVISLPAGIGEGEFIEGVREHLNLGPYVPIAWDCHTQMSYAFWRMGVPYPGAPGGRSNIGTYFGEYFMGVFSGTVGWMYTNHGLNPP